MQVRSQVPLNHDVRCCMHHMWVTGAKDSCITMVSRNEVVIVTVLQLQLQLQCCSCNRNVTVKVKVTRSQGMRRRKNGVLHRLHRHIGK